MASTDRPDLDGSDIGLQAQLGTGGRVVALAQAQQLAFKPVIERRVNRAIHLHAERENEQAAFKALYGDGLIEGRHEGTFSARYSIRHPH